MSLEQEIKMVVQQTEPLKLDSLDWLQEIVSEPPEQKHLISTYFDTPELALKKFGVGLRMRKVNEQWLQTVKCSGHAVNGLHQRKEWEHDLMQPEFDLQRLKETDLAPLIDDESVWPNIREVFTTDFVRSQWILKLSEGTEIELAYDQGLVMAGDKQAPIHEIELELKGGDLAKMLELAERLKAALPLDYSDISKAGQGYSLAQHTEK